MRKNLAVAISAALVGVAAADLAAADLGEDLLEAVTAAEAEVPLTEAFAIAARHVSGGSVVEYEIDVEDDALSYIIDIKSLSGLHVIEVDGRTGRAKRIED